MKEQFLNIFNASSPAQKLKFNKRVSAILVCFFVSLIFWFLIALSKEYSTTLTFTVRYSNLPGQMVVVNELPSSVGLNIKTSGFNILSYHFGKEKETIAIDVSSKTGASFNPSSDVLVIPMKTFSDDFTGQLGEDIVIQNFIPDSLVFNFSSKITKRVPVVLQMNINFEKQYDSIGVYTLSPDSVDVSGPLSVIRTTHAATTEFLDFQRVKEPISRNVHLLTDKLLTLSDTIVKLKVPVEKFTEENVEVPLQMIKVPAGYSLKTFPDKITVRYQVALSMYNSIKPSSFAAVVNAEKVTDSRDNKIKVELISVPSYVKFVSIVPERVDYILRKQ